MSKLVNFCEAERRNIFMILKIQYYFHNKHKFKQLF